ncbi:MAG TPA: DUF885 domain-containing protein, partial [Novosphingobium sp.]|nr:DUF885 domain-containing protein [Novosphingobium sp.]
MQNNALSLSRRDALGAIGAGSLALVLPGCAGRPLGAPAAADPAALLDDIAWRLVAHDPERATQKGVDTGAHAALRGRLGDRSQAGQDAFAATLRADLARVEALETATLDPVTRTTVDVVRSAYRSALEGFALPYGDVAVGSFRNTPYPVIQNVVEYIDAPNLLDADHP